MHTLQAGPAIWIHHNGDWSGDAIVHWGGGEEIGEGSEVVIPGDVLKKVAAAVSGRSLRDALLELADMIED